MGESEWCRVKETLAVSAKLTTRRPYSDYIFLPYFYSFLFVFLERRRVRAAFDDGMTSSFLPLHAAEHGLAGDEEANRSLAEAPS